MLLRRFFCIKGVESVLVTKKINNNVAVCLDGNGRELVAFGKGIGFPAMPYELTDLKKIDRTFYDIGHQYLPLLDDIPEDVLMLTARMMDDIRPDLPYETSPNIVLTLADHIAFAIERHKKGVYIQLPSVYQLDQSYPLEIKLGRQFVEAVHEALGIRLPKNEVQGIAMHFINARNGMVDPESKLQEKNQVKFEEMLETVTQIIEQELDIAVRRDCFNYARFATHMEYLLQRLFKHQHIDSDNMQMYTSIREEYPQISACVDKISSYYHTQLGTELTEEEKLYLILHVNRVCAKENE